MPDSEPSRADYNGSGIFNLMQSLLAGLGVETFDTPLKALPPAAVANRRNVVLLVLDGLGAELLTRHPHGFLARHLGARITSVFPTTTASAVTTFYTGLAPSQHGLMGWFTYLRELGGVTTVLPFRPRHGGPTFSELGVAPDRIYDWTPMADRVEAQAHVVNPAHLVDSDYSRSASGRARRRGYTGLEQLTESICAAVNTAGERNFVHAYWPVLDATAHQYGIGSPQVAEHLQQLDQAVAALAGRLAGTDTLLLVTADHGLVDTTPERTIHLDQHPGLADTLTLPLCGEPRLAYCYVHPRRTAQFEAYVRGELAHCCRMLPSEQVIEEGWFGPPPRHSRLMDRVGDYVLLMQDNWVIRDRVAGEKPFEQIGVHGGLSTDELWVPLVTVDIQ